MNFMAVSDVKQALENLVANEKMLQAIEETGSMSIALINDRTQKGEFLGGAFANKGYSETTLPFFFFSKDIQAAEDDIEWRKVKGKSVKYLKGGYKKYRELRGKQVATVNHELDGKMMNSLFAQVDIVSDAQFKVIVTVPGAEMLKAYYTNEKRQWLALSDDEVDRVFRLFEKRMTEG